MVMKALFRSRSLEMVIGNHKRLDRSPFTVAGSAPPGCGKLLRDARPLLLSPYQADGPLQARVNLVLFK